MIYASSSPPFLERPTRHTKALQIHIQVLSLLGFPAAGTFQGEIGDRLGISRPNTAAGNTVVMRDFCAIAGLPRVGAIDCEHIEIRLSSFKEFAHENRKLFHSVNVQIICML